MSSCYKESKSKINFFYGREGEEGGWRGLSNRFFLQRIQPKNKQNNKKKSGGGGGVGCRVD